MVAPEIGTVQSHVAPVLVDVGNGNPMGTVEYHKEALSRAYSRKIAANNSGGRRGNGHFQDREEVRSPVIFSMPLMVCWSLSSPASPSVTLVPMRFGMSATIEGLGVISATETLSGLAIYTHRLKSSQLLQTSWHSD